MELNAIELISWLVAQRPLAGHGTFMWHSTLVDKKILLDRRDVYNTLLERPDLSERKSDAFRCVVLHTSNALQLQMYLSSRL